MKKNTRLVLLAVMLIVMVALTAMFTSAATIEVAEGGDLNAAIAGAAAGDTIQINGTVEVIATITIDKDLTITGTGTINQKAETAGICFEVTAGNVVFEGITIKSDLGSSNTALIRVGGKDTKPTVTVNSGTYYAFDYYVFRVTEGGTLTVNDATCTSGLDKVNGDGNKDASGGVFDVAGSAAAPANIVVNGGYFSGYRTAHVGGSGIFTAYDGTFRSNPGQDNSCLFTVGGGNTVNLHGGDWECTGAFANFNNPGTITITGGSYKHITGDDPNDDDDYFFRLSDGNENITISGGYFYSEGKAEMFQKNNGGFTIKGGTFEYAGSGAMFYGVSGKTNGTWYISNVTLTMTGTGKMFQMESGFGVNANNVTMTISGGAAAGQGDLFTGYSPCDFTNCKLIATGSGRAAVISGNGGFSFTNCEISAANADAIVVTQGAKINMVDCSITSTTGIAVNVKATGSLTMELNTIDAYGVGIQLPVDAEGAALVLTDNTITSETSLSVDIASGHEVTCYGGVFNDADGLANAVVISNPSFQINNGLTFGSARGASRELKDGDVLKVLQDTLAAVYLNANATFTVEGNGFTTGALTVAAGNVTINNLNVVASSGRAIHITGTAGTVVINGGSFVATAGTGMRVDTETTKVTISNASIKAANGGALNCVEVVISGANADKTRDQIAAGDPLVVIDQVDMTGGASTYSGVMLQANVRIDILSGKYEGCQAWFRITGCTKAVFNIGNPDASKPQPDCIDASTRAIHIQNGSFGSLVTIYGGRYELTSKSAASYYINCAGADVHVAGGTFIGRIEIFSMHDGDVVSPVKISGGEFLMEGAASVINFRCAMSTVYPENNNFEMAGHVHITGGNFISSGYGDLVHVTSTKELGTCVIDGGTFRGTDARLVYTQKTTVPVVINGGDFSGEGVRLIWAYHGSNLTINGGTFTLLELPKAAEGETQKVVDFDHCVVANGGQSSNDVKIYGGTFINQRTGAPQLIFCQNPTTRFYVAGGEYYTINAEGYFIRDMVDLVTGSLKVDPANKKTIGGKEYYALALTNATSNYAPLMSIMPSIRSDLEAQGIRFSATVPGSVVEALTADGSTVSYGTIIVPAEFVKGMTGDYLTALKALATSKGVDESKVFANVVANKGLSTNEKTGDVTFHASLVNIKEENWGRDMIGIAYVQVTAADGTVTYHYAAVNPTASLSMTDVATIAYNDNNDAPAYVGAKSYAWRSIKDDNLFNRYSKTKQESFKKYMGIQ